MQFSYIPTAPYNSAISEICTLLRILALLNECTDGDAFFAGILWRRLSQLVLCLHLQEVERGPERVRTLDAPPGGLHRRLRRLRPLHGARRQASAVLCLQHPACHRHGRARGLTLCSGECPSTTG